MRDGVEKITFVEAEQVVGNEDGRIMYHQMDEFRRILDSAKAGICQGQLLRDASKCPQSKTALDRMASILLAQNSQTLPANIQSQRTALVKYLQNHNYGSAEDIAAEYLFGMDAEAAT
ncbi:hypothetical protein N7495_007038 [Penicillium taxi]|uniref:uncharacterized protein n=1 Tax=Penicillium taxi TaxID=168475 RepID=UPI002545B024|nr:uncharacterized protein N7495_007038 [Penicillium taxi]KAJ5895347.1 hypothetical protein N7495_007038 [Penicillium taxi]